MAEGEPNPDVEEIEGAAEYAELQKSLADTEARLKAVSRAYAELEADKASYRKRMDARSKIDADLRTFKTVKAFLDPVMNLKRSLAAAHEPDALVSGLQMVYKQFMAALVELGLEEVSGVGSAFDPNHHEALGTVAVDDASLDGTIVEVHSEGFAVNGKVLLASRVIVGAYTQPASDDE